MADDDKDKEGLPPGFVLKQDRWADQPAAAAPPAAPEKTFGQRIRGAIGEAVEKIPAAAEKTHYGAGVFAEKEHPEVALAKSGYEHLKSGEYQQGAHELIGAGMEFLRPTSGLMGAEGAIPAAKMIARGYVGGAVGKTLGPVVGLTPELGGDIGTLTATQGPGREKLRARPEETTLPTMPRVIPSGGLRSRPARPPESTLPAAEAPPPAPARPTAGAQLDDVAMRIFKKPYEALTSEEQRVVARNTGGAPAAERRTTVGQAPTMERRAGAMPLPTKAPEAGNAPLDIYTDANGIRWAKGGPGEPDVSIPKRLTDPADISKHVADLRALQGRRVLGGAPTTPGGEIAPPGQPAAQGPPSETLPRTGPPAAPPPTTLGGGQVPPATLDEILRQSTGQKPLEPNVPLNEQLRRGQPSVSEKPPPQDPLKAEFPDPAIRRYARANGAELLRAAGDRPEVIQAVHDLNNVEVRQAAINAGIDVGQKHVGARTGLGPEGQVGRQDLIDQMLRKGVKPEDIPGLARPKAQTIPLANLKQGDTFVDETGEPRRIVEITKDGKIKTADGSVRIYKGAIESQGELNSMRAQLARGGKFIPHVPEDLERHLEPDEIEFLKNRPLLQKNVTKNYGELGPTIREAVNVARAGHGLGGWWQRFMDTFDALGASTEAQQIKQLGPSHAEALKALHGAVSGNKAVEQANVIAWGVYRDWLEAGRPTDLTSINRIVRANRGMSGRGGLDTQKVFKLVNSPQFKEGVPFTGEAFLRSPVEGVSPGAKKIPSMVATTAGQGNLKRVVFDTHMKDLYGINNLSDAQYLAASIHIRQAGEALGYAAGEAQEQMWGTVLGLKQLLGKGLSPRQAAQAFSKDVLASVGKDYAQVIQESMNDPEVQEIMRDLKKYGFDPGGPVASERLRQIVTEGAKRMSERARPVSRGLLEKTARRIASSRAGP